MKPISLKKQVSGSLEEIVNRATAALKNQGFGVLTRIDLHSKIKEKLNKEIPVTVILGACNPGLAYEAFQASTDVTALLPCNAVVREVGDSKFSVELVKPSSLLAILGDSGLTQMAIAADDLLTRALEEI